jgi:NAD(P)H-flavin reductase
VTRIETLTPTIKGVWIKLDAPIRFQAGQYVNLELPGGIGSRAFSIASPPSAAARWSSTSASCRAGRAPPTSMKDAGR